MERFGTTLGVVLGSFRLSWALLGPSWGPRGPQSLKKERKSDVLNLVGWPERPKGCQRCPKDSKIDILSVLLN